MSDLKKLIDGLPIEIISADCITLRSVSGFLGSYNRSHIEALCEYKKGADVPTSTIGWRVILALMDEAQEEVSVSKDSAEFAKKSRGIPLNISGGEVDEAEQKPEWEPGTLVRHRRTGQVYRLDKFLRRNNDTQDAWDFTEMEHGTQLFNGFFDLEEYEVHRLPHEFKVGDWAAYLPTCPFEVAKVEGFKVYRNNDQCYAASALTHVPPPKESRAVETSEKLPISPTASNSVETLHRQRYGGDCRESPFQGPHWDMARANAKSQSRDIACAAMQCLCDLADELRRTRGGK